MEEKAHIKPAMVSRLPKFGVRPATGVTSPLPNGTTQPTTPPQDGKTSPPARPNGVVRASSSLKWRKDGDGTPTTPTSPEHDACPQEGGDKPKTQHSPWGKEIKKPSPSTPKGVRRSGASVSTTSSPRAIPRQAAKTSPKAGPRQGQSTSLSGGPKLGQNGATDGSGRSGSGLVRPRASSSSPRSSSRDSLSQSSDSLMSLTLDNMVRSQSFTHFKQIPSPTNLPMARSFSFNRAVELAKPLANTQLQPPRTNHIKTHQLSNGRLGLGMGLGLGGLQYPRSLSSAYSPSTTPSALKKPLLPNCVLNKPSALCYKLMRPGQVKQQKPQFTGRVKGEVRAVGVGDGAESPPLTLTPDPLSDSDRTSGGQLRGTGEGLEDMSLSSASSLSRGDTSEEFLDDFDNLADGDVPENRTRGSTATQTRLRSFLKETMDWDGMGLSGRKEGVGVRTDLGILPPERGDFLQGSSLELSPSNSSGGTYMWDEEDLEPLGPRTHPSESYDDSDPLNSMDILNNLDNLEQADLEDDDFMLDVDIPEDGSLRTQTIVAPDADGMAHFDCSERRGRKGHWRRRQPRWNGLDHFHNDNRGPVFQQYDGGFMVGPRPLPPVGIHDGHTRALDELTLKHMAQDCSSVKNQLLKLKSLLQMEDGGPEVVEEDEDDNSTTLQLEELMKEVRELREELQDKERTITQLTLQQQATSLGGVSATRRHHRSGGTDGRTTTRPHRPPGEDKETAILVCCPPPSSPPGRASTRGRPAPACPSADRPQILQSSSPSHHEHLTLERLVKTALTEGHSDPQRRRSTPPVPNPDELSALLSTQLNIHYREGLSIPSPTQGLPTASSSATVVLSRPEGGKRASPEGPGCPRVLQRPRLHKRVSVPALPQRYANGSLLPSGSEGLLANHRTKQLPPPSRGLPCFNSGPQAVGPSLGRGVLAQPRTLGVRRDLPSTSPPCPSLEMPDLGLLRARVLVPPSLSRLPKPKIH